MRLVARWGASTLERSRDVSSNRQLQSKLESIIVDQKSRRQAMSFFTQNKIMIEQKLDEEKHETAAKQATLESLLPKGAESAQQNAALDEQIAARISEIFEAEAKRAARKQFALE